MSKNYKSFITEASGYIAGAILQPGARRDIELFLKRVSNVNHGDNFFDQIDQRFAAHGYKLDYSPLNNVDLDDGGEVELNIYEISTGRLVDDGATTVDIEWSRMPIAHNPENANNAVSKQYVVKATLVTIMDGDEPEGALSVDSDDVTPDFTTN